MNGILFNGIAVDPVTHLLDLLQAKFSAVEEKGRLIAITEMIAFERLPDESIDFVLERFEAVRQRAALEGQFVICSESCALQLLRICDIQAQHLDSLLQPFSGQLPQNDVQLQQMCAQLRRCSTTEEGTTGIGSGTSHEPPLQSLAEACQANGDARDSQNENSCTADATIGTWNENPWGSGSTEPWIPGEHQTAFSTEVARRDHADGTLAPSSAGSGNDGNS